MQSIPLLRQLILISAVFTCCTKQNSPANPEVIDDSIFDNSQTSPFGRLLLTPRYGKDHHHFQWGRNAEEVFLTVQEKAIRIELNTKQIESLGSGSIHGKSNDNKEVIFAGTGHPGSFFSYNYFTNAVSKLFDVEIGRYPNITIAGNTHFFDNATASSTCIGVFCYPSDFKSELYHINRSTGEKKYLPGKSFLLFSKDGSKSLLFRDTDLYFYDNASATITDSMQDFNIYLEGLNYDNNRILYLDKSDFASEQIKVRDMRTNEIVFSFIPEVYLSTISDIKWSADRSLIYYIGQSKTSLELLVQTYDVASQQITTIIRATNPRTHLWLLLSEDNKKIATQINSTVYIKEIW